MSVDSAGSLTSYLTSVTDLLSVGIEKLQPIRSDQAGLSLDPIMLRERTEHFEVVPQNHVLDCNKSDGTKGKTAFFKYLFESIPLTPMSRCRIKVTLSL